MCMTCYKGLSFWMVKVHGNVTEQHFQCRSLLIFSDMISHLSACLPNAMLQHIKPVLHSHIFNREKSICNSSEVFGSSCRKELHFFLRKCDGKILQCTPRRKKLANTLKTPSSESEEFSSPFGESLRVLVLIVWEGADMPYLWGMVALRPWMTGRGGSMMTKMATLRN